MQPAVLCLLAGACCALCVGIPCWLLVKAQDERERLRRELQEARRTIMNLHRKMGLTETTIAPWNRRH